MTMFYRFRQNNSGGYYKDPARNLFIAAPSAEVAKIAAQTFAVYFDGVYKGLDCDCCGDRWHSEPDAMCPEDMEDFFKSVRYFENKDLIFVPESHSQDVPYMMVYDLASDTRAWCALS